MDGSRRVSSAQLLAKMFGRHRVPQQGPSLRLTRHSSTTDLFHDVTNTVSVMSVATSLHQEELMDKMSTSLTEEYPSVSMKNEDSNFGSSIDLRYGGQYLSPDQLPQFCDQLHHLVSVVRNIQSYARTTGEYPRELERRLDSEAREVASLLAEAKNAREVVERARAQRKALRNEKQHAVSQLNTLRETEIRELETTVRLSDRKLYKNWETLRDANDPVAFDSLLDEIKNKSTALDSLARLIDGKKAQLAGRPPSTPSRHLNSPFVSVTPAADEETDRQPGGRRAAYKRRRRDRQARSVPLSGQPSNFGSTPVNILEESETATGNSGPVMLPASIPQPPPLPNIRDILFFTNNM